MHIFSNLPKDHHPWRENKINISPQLWESKNMEALLDTLWGDTLSGVKPLPEYLMHPHK